MAFKSIDDFSAIVEGIYDCALAPDKWREMLPRIARYMDSDTSTFAIYDTLNGERHRYYDYGIAEAAVRSYFEVFAPLNPTLEAKAVFGVGEPYTLRMVLDEAEYLDSRFYKEWAKPNGQGDIMGVTAMRVGSRMATHAVSRLDHRPNYSKDDLQRYRLLVPHVCRSLSISDAIELKTVTSLSLADALDAVRAGVFLLGRNQQLLHMNEAGARMTARGDAITIANGRLLAVDGGSRTALHDAIATASAVDQTGVTVPPTVALHSPNASGLIANVLPLRDGRRFDVAKPVAAVVAVFVHSPEDATPFPGQAFAQLYGLTAGELRVALAIAPGLGVQETAEALGVSTTTVKTHLARIFVKTGSRGQTELIALLQRATGPVRQ